MQIDGSYSSLLVAQQAKADSTADVAKSAKEAKDEAKLKEACKGFEAMFLGMMYKEMRSTVPENTLFGNSNADKIMQDMLDTEMVNNMADAGGVGLADVIYKQLKQDAQAKSDMAQRAAEQRAARLNLQA